MDYRYGLYIALLPLALAYPMSVRAQEVQTETSVTPVQEADADGKNADDPFALDKSVDEERLGSVAGREDTAQISTAEQTAGVSRNSVGDHTTTGSSEIGGQAFQNMSGLSILNVNTGNNVAINAAMNVNISISPNP